MTPEVSPQPVCACLEATLTSANLNSNPNHLTVNGRYMGGTSIQYIRSRLERAGEWDLLRAIDERQVSAYAAGEAAGLFQRPRTLGTGSTTRTKRRIWAMLRAVGEVDPMPPRPQSPKQHTPGALKPVPKKLSPPRKRRARPAAPAAEPAKPAPQAFDEVATPPFDPTVLIA